VDAPSVVTRRAREAGLDAIAITDHDSVAGIPEARETGKSLGLDVIPGCELTAYLDDEEIHVLGYGIDWEDTELAGHLEWFREGRHRRLEEMVRRLKGTGVSIALERILELAGNESAVGRVHVARALLEAGEVSSFPEAFARYLGKGRPGHVPKLAISPARAIEVIHRAGGAAVLAHPAVNNLQNRIPDLVKEGLDGIEVWHSLHRPDQSEALFATAQRYALLKTGGSDCHGALPGRLPMVGSVRIELGYVEALRRAVAQKRNRDGPRSNRT